MPGTYQLFASRPAQVMTRFEGLPVEIRAGETAEVDLPVEIIVEDGGDLGAALHRELGSGVSFDTGPGGVAVSFLMPDSPALAGVRVGDLVLSIDGEPVVRTLDAFERLQRPRGQAVALTLRRDGQDLTVTIK